MFFLSADAFGVLPPVARLSKEQAMFYFVLGYTAKLAGTEIGVVEPQATFSACFGAPFMLRPPNVYAELLGHYLEKYSVKVWLINTGWTAGPYGQGHRFPLHITREIIRAIQHNELDTVSFEKGTHLWPGNSTGHVREVPSSMLGPRSSWASGEQVRRSRPKSWPFPSTNRFGKSFPPSTKSMRKGPLLTDEKGFYYQCRRHY